MTLSLSAHCFVVHGLTSCPATSPAYSILVVRVNLPGRDKPVFISIGLAGNGSRQGHLVPVASGLMRLTGHSITFVIAMPVLVGPGRSRRQALGLPT